MNNNNNGSEIVQLIFLVPILVVGIIATIVQSCTPEPPKPPINSTPLSYRAGHATKEVSKNFIRGFFSN